MSLVLLQHLNLPIRMFLTVTICMEAREVMSNWASLGRQTRGSMSSKGDGPDDRVGGPNASGGNGNCHCLSRGSGVLAATYWHKSFFWLDGLIQGRHLHSLGLWVLAKQGGLLCGVGEATGSSSADSSKEASQKSSSSSCRRGTGHLCRSWTVTHIISGGALDHSAQNCEALASATVCSFLFLGCPWFPGTHTPV